jgi:hypothetical protein
MLVAIIRKQIRLTPYLVILLSVNAFICIISAGAFINEPITMKVEKEYQKNVLISIPLSTINRKVTEGRLRG